MRGGAVVAWGFLLVALSGCLSEEPKAQDDDGAASSTAGSSASDTSSATASGSGSATATSTASSPGNAAPAIEAFTANASGLSATFLFEASDADGDALTYVLAFGDNGTDATGDLTDGAGNVTHAFTAAGRYNVTLTVSDGQATANQTLAVNVTAAAAAAPLEEYTCTVDLPAIVFSVSGLPIAFGFCEFVETTVQTILVVAEPAAGCTIRLDENTSDTTAGPVIQQGSTNPPGQYGMRCDIQGPSLGGDGRIVIQAA